MRIPTEWLRDFVEIKKNPKALAEDLTSLGFETEVLGQKEELLRNLESEITPNRGDCLSVFGIARELAALYNLKLKTHPPSPRLRSGLRRDAPRSLGEVGQNSKLKIQKLDKPLEVTFQDKKICPRYSYRIIDGIKISSSPKWLQKRLIACGFRPINNIVDITNYVMLELGQPLHAFDYQKIEGCKMIVRRAKDGEKLTTLDGISRDLNKQALVIQDEDKLIDLAGIMGGQNSEIGKKTTALVLQAAIFDPILIRMTSKRLNLVTDASYRYERQIDPNGTISALNRATELIFKTTPAKIGPIIDIVNVKKEPTVICWNPQEDVSKILGVKINERKISQYLKKLGFKGFDQVTVPSYRHDIKIKEDLTEEVARLYGYCNLFKNILTRHKEQKSKNNWTIKEKIKDSLVNLGFTETKSYSYLSRQDLDSAKISVKNLLEISNPLSGEFQYLRPALLPTALKSIAKNPWFSEIKIFEIGHVFKLEEVENIIILSTEKNQQFNLQKIPEQILQKFKIRKQIYFKEIPLSRFAKLINLPKMLKYDFEKIEYHTPSPFPPVVFDLAVLVNKDIVEQTVKGIIKNASPFVFLVELFDLYQGPQIPEGKKSLAYHITLSSSEYTLSDEEIKKVRQKIIHDLKTKANIYLRI